MEAPPQDGGADMEGVQQSTSGSVCVLRDVSLFTLVLPHASSASRTGCDDTDVAEALPRLSRYAFSPIALLPGVLRRVRRDRGSTTSHCPAVAGQRLVPRFNIPSRHASSGVPRQEGPSAPSRGLEISPPTRTVETVGLA